MKDHPRRTLSVRYPGLAVLLAGIVAAMGVAAACAPRAVDVKGSASSPTAAVPSPALAASPPPVQPIAQATLIPQPVPTPPQAPSAGNPTEGINVGQRAPDFALASLDNKQFRLSDFRGKTVLVNFWASWCPPCKEEMPALDVLYRKYRDRDFVVLAVDMAETPSTVEAFVKNGGFSFHVLLDRDGDTARTYQAISLPVSYVVGPDGIILDRIIGAMTPKVMETKTQRFLAAAGQPPAQPRSVAELQRDSASQVVATLGAEPITMADVNRRVDLMLALERLGTGAVLDPSRPSDQAELRERQRYAVDQIVNERLLADAARAADVRPNRADVDDPLRELASEAGGVDKLPAELAKHGVTIDDLEAYLQERALADGYVLQVLAKQPGAGSMDAAIQKWIEAERARRGVKILIPSP